MARRRTLISSRMKPSGEGNETGRECPDKEVLDSTSSFGLIGSTNLFELSDSRCLLCKFVSEAFDAAVALSGLRLYKFLSSPPGAAFFGVLPMVCVRAYTFYVYTSPASTTRFSYIKISPRPFFHFSSLLSPPRERDKPPVRRVCVYG